MSLREKLAAMRAASAGRVPPETLAVMRSATAAVGASGILDKVIRVGSRAPDFTLNDAYGVPVGTAALRQQGAVLLCFYRGVW